MYDWAVVVALLLVGAILLGFPVGIAFGYLLRSHVSRVRRARYLAERRRRRTKPDLKVISIATRRVR
jgi:hypothetical protein